MLIPKKQSLLHHNTPTIKKNLIILLVLFTLSIHEMALTATPQNNEKVTDQLEKAS